MQIHFDRGAREFMAEVHGDICGCAVTVTMSPKENLDHLRDLLIERGCAKESLTTTRLARLITKVSTFEIDSTFSILALAIAATNRS